MASFRLLIGIQRCSRHVCNMHKKLLNKSIRRNISSTCLDRIGNEKDVDIEKLPDPVARGLFTPVRLPAHAEPTVITFDLETTDLIRGRQMPHITQIAAVELKSGVKFSCYVMPKMLISTGAEQMTGIVATSSGMIVKGTHVKAGDICSVLNKFFKWLDKFPEVVLVAHNGKRFDFPVFMAALMYVGRVNKFCSCVTGLVDSLSMFRGVYPGRKSYKQEELVKSILKSTFGSHDALEDARSLGKLIAQVKLSTPDFMSYSFSPVAVYNARLCLLERDKNIKSLDPLAARGVVTGPTAAKIAGSGLQLCHLRTIYKREGENGLRNIFTAKNSDGEPRVTNSKQTLEEMIPKLVAFFGE